MHIRSCSRKIPHETEADAIAAMRSVLEEQYVATHFGIQSRAYRCDYCRKWHWGRLSREMRPTPRQRLLAMAAKRASAAP